MRAFSALVFKVLSACNGDSRLQMQVIVRILKYIFMFGSVGDNSL